LNALAVTGGIIVPEFFNALLYLHVFYPFGFSGLSIQVFKQGDGPVFMSYRQWQATQ
jgi:hypothetical protein